MESTLGQRLRELPGPLLLTGHTGFKGTWMTFLLEHLNVPVVGYSLPAAKDSLYERAERTGAITEVFADIRDYESLEQFIDTHKPSTIIHMAAQALVLQSYESPRETFEVNVIGTVNVLDIAFKKDFVKSIIVVTTDKVYRNNNSGRAFVETDPLEGDDPYSASKVGTESVVSAWQQIARITGGPKVISVRAGNVIGGGDFAENRIIPDIVKSALTGIPVTIRNPTNTRPWQHVLDPCIGYLMALEILLAGGSFTSLNFGPVGESLSVLEVSEISKTIFPGLQVSISTTHSSSSKESTFLALNANKSCEILNWRQMYTQPTAVLKTFEWWKSLISNPLSAEKLCREEVSEYVFRFFNI